MNLDEFGESGSNFLHPKNISEGLDTKKKRSHPLNISYTMLYPPFYGSKDVFYHILSPAKLPSAFLWGRPQMASSCFWIAQCSDSVLCKRIVESVTMAGHFVLNAPEIEMYLEFSGFEPFLNPS